MAVTPMYSYNITSHSHNCTWLRPFSQSFVEQDVFVVWKLLQFSANENFLKEPEMWDVLSKMLERSQHFGFSPQLQDG